MITYKLNTETGILETSIKGEVTIGDFINYIISLSRDKTLPKKLKIFSDATEGRFSGNTTPDDLIEIVEANNLSLAQRDFICDAFILSSSLETAMGQLYMKFSKADNYRFKVFSDKKAALKWLNSFS